MDKIQLAVVMAAISDKIAKQLAMSEDELFNILTLTDEVYNKQFIWKVGLHGSRIYFVDNYVHLHQLNRHKEKIRMYGKSFYYMWDGQLLYPVFELTINRLLEREFDKYHLFNEMIDIAHKHLGRLLEDYPYHDIQYVMDTNANAPFVWLIGRNTTYLCPMDDVEKLKIMIEKLDAVADECHSHKRYTCYVFGGEVLRFASPASVRSDAVKLIEELT
ncbi:MAG: hypothetical protein LBT43_07445 [Prevotella sp.]|jgi:hypothetical protein|nr:hypothetical protein [Prevotella sp.]